MDGTTPSPRRAAPLVAGPAGHARSGPRAADRVVRSHTQTRSTLAGSAAFLGAAGIAAAGGADRWLVLHLALAGGLVLAIAAVSLMLAVTWSAAPAPAGWTVVTLRTLLVTGTVGVGVGRSADAPAAVVAAAGAVHVLGLGTLGVLLVTTIRQGVERRFDPAVTGYLAALVAGASGVAIGTAMILRAPTAGWRSAHVTLNLLGLIGLVVAATLPYFAATVGRSRTSPAARPRHLHTALAAMVGGLAVAASALASGAGRVAAGGLAGYLGGVVATVWMLPRPTRRQLRWAGPRLVGLWAGSAWWAIAVAATMFDASSGRAVLTGRWLAVLVLGGYLQVLWASLAYLVPMLRGGGAERLAAGFALTRSWPALAAANLTALSCALAAPGRLATTAGGVWALDTGWRLGRVGLRSSRRDDRRGTVRS